MIIVRYFIILLLLLHLTRVVLKFTLYKMLRNLTFFKIIVSIVYKNVVIIIRERLVMSRRRNSYCNTR